MNFTRLKLSESVREKLQEKVAPIERDLSEVVRSKVHSNWRKELQEEHPYVEVFPSTDGQKKEGSVPKKKKVKTKLV